MSKIPGGSEFVAASLLNSLKESRFKTVLIGHKKVDAASFMKYFKTNVSIDQELVFPFWPLNIETYLEFLLPLTAKPFCDVVIDPYFNAALPCVDVTYIHCPKTYSLCKKAQEAKFWNYYYKPFQFLENVLSLKASDKLFIANSRFTAERTENQLGLAPIVIYPPVNVEMFCGSNSSSFKKNLIVTVSRFSSEKNLEDIPIIAKKVNADFVILGSIEDTVIYRKILGLIREHSLKDKVKLILNASLDTKIDLLQKAKVYLNPMHSEHFGISIVEGMAAGGIPIVHDSGGPREFVPDKWRYSDLEEAAQKISEALDSWCPTIAQEMKTSAYRFRKERFQNEFLIVLNSYLLKKGHNT
jgi:alpha-1,2-mannosyltransferase